MEPLRLHELLNFDRRLLLFDIVGQLALHFKENLVNFEEFLLEIRSHVNQALGQILSGAIEHSIAHISLPQAENFSNQVVFKEFHARQHIEHGALLHPVGKRQKFGRNQISALFALRNEHAILVLEDLSHTLRTDRVILVVQVFNVGGVGSHNEVVGAKLGAMDLAAVAIQELDGHVGAVFGEKGDCLLACLNFHEEFVDGSAFAAVVRASHSDCLVFLLLFLLLKETLQILKLKVVLSLTFAFSGLLCLSFGFHLVFHVRVHLLPVGFCHLRVHLNQISVHVVHHLARHHRLSVGSVLVLAVSLEWRQLGRVDHSRSVFVLICGVSENERRVALERQMVLGELNV